MTRRWQHLLIGLACVLTCATCRASAPVNASPPVPRVITSTPAALRDDAEAVFRRRARVTRAGAIRFERTGAPLDVEMAADEAAGAPRLVAAEDGRRVQVRTDG